MCSCALSVILSPDCCGIVKARGTLGTGYNEQQSAFRAIYVRSNIQYDAGTFQPKVFVNCRAHPQYSAVDKDLDKERSYDPLPGYYQITNSLYTGCLYVAVCSKCVNVCLCVCMHMGMYVCVHVYAFMILHVT